MIKAFSEIYRKADRVYSDCIRFQIRKPTNVGVLHFADLSDVDFIQCKYKSVAAVLMPHCTAATVVFTYM
jgi:hypothetical protein